MEYMYLGTNVLEKGNINIHFWSFTWGTQNKLLSVH